MDRGTWWATVHGVAKESDMTEGTHVHTHTYPYRFTHKRTSSASDNSTGSMHNHLKIRLEALLVQREHLKYRQKQILKITVHYCSSISLTLVP